jgi:hypothetical protein
MDARQVEALEVQDRYLKVAHYEFADVAKFG